MDKKFYFFAGTAAEFIKLAPIMKELRDRGIKFKLITSGQNKINFQESEGLTGPIKADIQFQEKPHKSSLFLFFIWSLKTLLHGIFFLGNEFKGLNKNNSYFIVHGDTVSALIGSLIAVRYRLKLVHIESGLRSFNFFEPFPEEICRYINIHLADVLFAPSDWAYGNLKNLKGEKVNTYQNTLIEAWSWASRSQPVSDFRKKFGNYYVLMMHRQEHIYFHKDWTRKVLDMVMNNANKNLNCIFIMHALTSRFFESEKIDAISQLGNKIIILPRLAYPEFMQLMNNAEFIATDGCTNQEESYYMGLPMLSLRNLTERSEGLDQNVVLAKGIEKTIKDFLANYKQYRRKPSVYKKSPAKIIVDYLSLN